eukprot:6369279-Prymnesium_polylepis.2
MMRAPDAAAGLHVTTGVGGASVCATESVMLPRASFDCPRRPRTGPPAPPPAEPTTAQEPKRAPCETADRPTVVLRMREASSRHSAPEDWFSIRMVRFVSFKIPETRLAPSLRPKGGRRSQSAVSDSSARNGGVARSASSRPATSAGRRSGACRRMETSF